MSSPAFTPVRVELWSGKIGGLLRYFVDFVEADGGRSGMWNGPDRDEGQQAARECADLGDGTFLPVVDVTGAEAVEIPAGTVH